jgi:hypothetical protein
MQQGADPSACNKSGRSPITDMIEKIPKFVESDILDSRRRVASKYLVHNHPTQPTPVDTMVQLRRLDLIGHPLIVALFEFKWEVFARDAFIHDLIVYFIMLILWTYVVVSATTQYRNWHALFFSFFRLFPPCLPWGIGY